MIFGTWNVQGLSRKISETISRLKETKVDVAVVTETKKKGQGSENLGFYDHFYSGVPKEKRAQQGISILIRRSLRRFITSWEAISERIIKMNINIHNYRVTLLGCYAVNEDTLVDTKDEFFEQLNEEITKVGTSRDIILMGDLNSRVGKKPSNEVVGNLGEEVVNNNGIRLITICEQNNLKIMNGFYQHKNIHKYTWTQTTRNLKSIIDYLIIKQRTRMEVHDVRVQRGVTCGSDHHLLRSKICFPGRYAEQTNNNNKDDTGISSEISERRYNLDSLEQESTRRLYQKRLDEKLITQETFLDVNQMHEYISRQIHEAALEALGPKEKSKKFKQYWWDTEIEEAIKDKREKYQKYICTKSDSDKSVYKEAQAKVRRKITQKKNETWERKCNQLNTHIGGTRSTESWRLIKNLRQDKKKDLITSIDMKTWEDYFKDLLTENRQDFKNENENPENIVTIGSPVRIEPKEVKEICKSLKNRKAAGPGDISPELLKHGTDKLFTLLSKLFNKCMSEEKVPKEWKTSYLSTIYKKGDKGECENYRGIAVSSTISRIYGKIIKNKVENEYTDIDAEEQAGFRAGRSTIDHIYCVTQLIEKKMAYNQELHLLYIDLRKAYDTVPLTKLWEALEKTNISVNLIKAIKQLYKDNQIKIKVGNKVSNGFNVNKGLKQGCCLSPTLFKIYLEQVLKSWKRKCRPMGIPLEELNLFTLCFADDQIIIAQDYEDIEYMTRKIIEEYHKWGLAVNIKKTEYMCIGGVQQDLILETGQRIKQCHEYKYLGVRITENGTLDKAIQERCTQGRKAISLLNSVLWDQTISKQNKHRIYNTIIKPISTYGSEVWPMKERSGKMLRAVEMDFWRRSAGKSRLEKIRNERIREIMGVKRDIIEDITIKQLRWYGHIQRMENERIPKQILRWTPTGRRRRGRPRRSWIEGIRNEMRDRGLEEDQWNDRREWRLGIGRRRRTL